jgi:TonB family protein
MTTAVANANEFPLSRFVVYSLILHAALLASIVASIIFNPRGERWSDVGGSSGQVMEAKLVGNAGSLPMPQPPTIAESKAFDPTSGLYKEQPQPKPPAPPKDATPIPKFEKEKPVKTPPHPSKVFENKTPPPPNAVNYGKGGAPPIPSGYNSTPGSSSSGVAMPGGGGDFATRFGWYIQAVKRRIDPNWDKLSIDANVRNSTILHSAISFTISRDGSIKNIRVSESSGNLSWDNAGLRAIYNSNPLPALPSEYTSTEVSVTWDFPETKRQ